MVHDMSINYFEHKKKNNYRGIGIIFTLIFAFIVLINFVNAAAPLISNPNPADDLMAVKHNSTLSATIYDSDNNLLNINI